MRDYGKVYSKFWTSDDTRGLSDDAKMLALYLLTCPHANMLGCFRLPLSYAAEDLQWTTERVLKGFGELSKIGFIYRDEKTSFVILPQYLKWNAFENPNVGKHAVKWLATIAPPREVKALLVKALLDFGKHFPEDELKNLVANTEGVLNPLETLSSSARNPEPQPEPEPEPEPEPKTLVGLKPDDSVSEVFEFWKSSMNSPRSVLDSKRKTLIKNALKVFTKDDLLSAIRGCLNSPFHMGKNDNKKLYNGIDLIFRNADKIESFMGLDDGISRNTEAETPEERRKRVIDEAKKLRGSQKRGDDDGMTLDMEGGGK